MLSRIELTRAILLAGRGPYTLLYGVGARALSHELCGASEAGSADALALSRPNAAEAAELVQWAHRTPTEGAVKLLLVDLGEMSYEDSERMLPLTEETPNWFSVIFSCWHRVSPKLESRCDVFQLETVTDQSYDSLELAKVKVLPVLKALALKDRSLLEKAAAGFDQQALDVFLLWLNEAITGKWDLFNEEESFGLNKDPMMVRRMLISLHPDIRPKLLLKTAFEELMK